MILTNGTIVTMSQPAEAEALAITGEQVIAVGGADEIMALASADTIVVDIGGRVVYPGFTDAHSHWYQPDRIGDYGPEQINQVLLSRGWTGTDDANVYPEFADLLFEWHEAGRIDLRMNAYVAVNSAGPDPERFGDWFLDRGISPGTMIGNRLRIAGVKIFIGADWDRYQKWQPSEFSEAIAKYHQAGWQIAAKQIRDESLDLAFAAFGAVTDRSDDRRHRLEHALEMRADQIPRIAELGLVPIVQLGGIESDLLGDPSFEDMVADDGLEAVWPFRDMAQAGVPFVGSIAVVPIEGLRSPFTLSVMQMVHGAITGVSEVGAEPWDGRDRQLMTIDEAIESITTRAAWVTFEEDRRGSLAPGMLADLVVFSDDLRTAESDPEVLKSITVDATVVGGELLWCGFGLDDWCAGFGQPTPERLLDEVFLSPLFEGDLGGESASPAPVEGLTVTASSFTDGHSPELAFDGKDDGESFWSSGAGVPGWIQVGFSEPRSVSALRFTVFQNPPSDTVHVLEIVVDGEWREVYTFTGFTSTGDVLEWVTEPTRTEGFRITTTESESWPEWYEIEIVE